MRSVFSWNVFRGYLQEEFSAFEYSFLKKVFSQAAFSFGAFGTLVCALASLSKASWASSVFNNGFTWAVVAILALISGLALMFYYLPRYHSDPLDVTPKFVKRAYITLIITYGTIFYGILQLLGASSSLGSSSSIFIPGALLFGATLLVYAVPVSIGFFMRKHTKAIKLSQFVKACCIAHMVIFLLVLLVSFIPKSSRAFLQQPLYLFSSLLIGAVVFASPILSVYRMKMVVRYLDQTDQVAIKKWELFFVFEILVQLMQMAFYLARLLFNCLACGILSSRR